LCRFPEVTPTAPLTEAAMTEPEERGIPHGGITELVPFGIALPPFKDPDGIQLEIGAPL
jgi:hypothetical protein